MRRALAWLAGLIAALILLPVAIAIVHYRVIPAEEKYLEQRFGKEYLDYKARVPRWLPAPLCRPGPRRRPRCVSRPCFRTRTFAPT